jgi:hypothetical protein
MAELIDFAGYADCIKLENEHTRVILGPHCGGRVLEYAREGENALMLDPEHDGWIRKEGREPLGHLFPSGGRFDIGPEHIIPKHPELWYGRWQAEMVDDGARMVSQESESTGTQLVREFALDADSSRLTCTQIIENVSERETRWCHWARTFAQGHGICLVPLTPQLTHLPRQYVMYSPGPVINVRPEEPAVRVQGDMLQVIDTPTYPKLGFDSFAGWFGYLMPNDLLFLKRFPTYPERVYNDLAGFTLCIYYYKDVVCELEPIGPMELLAPGESAAFTEEWWLVPYPFPGRRDALVVEHLTEVAQEAMQG